MQVFACWFSSLDSYGYVTAFMIVTAHLLVAAHVYVFLLIILLIFVPYASLIGILVCLAYLSAYPVLAAGHDCRAEGSANLAWFPPLMAQLHGAGEDGGEEPKLEH